MNAPNFNVVMLAKGKARVNIYDVIGPSFFGMIDTKMVSRRLDELGEVDEIELHINSPGGFVFEGIGIHNVLKNHPAKVTTIIDGQAASIASLIAMAGDTIHIPSNGAMFLHESLTSASGNKTDLRKAIEDLEAANTAAIATYAARTKQSAATVAKWLKDETWFVGQEAVDAGLADTTDAEASAEKLVVAASVRQMYAAKQHDLSSLFGISMQLKEPPQMADPNPKPSPDPAPKPAPSPSPDPAPGSEPNPAPKQLTEADVQAAAGKAVADERSRIAAITAVCQKAGKPDMANEFIANGTSLADVQTRMFEVLCAARPPVGDAGGTDPTQTKDPDAALKKEYADNRVTLQKSGITEEDYVSSRKVTDEHQGRVSELPKPAKTKAA